MIIKGDGDTPRSADNQKEISFERAQRVAGKWGEDPCRKNLVSLCTFDSRRRVAHANLTHGLLLILRGLLRAAALIARARNYTTTCKRSSGPARCDYGGNIVSVQRRR